MYEIVTRYSDNDEWTNEVGDDNAFETPAEALDVIATQLRNLGPGWREAEYAVRVKGERYPVTFA